MAEQDAMSTSLRNIRCPFLRSSLQKTLRSPLMLSSSDGLMFEANQIIVMLKGITETLLNAKRFVSAYVANVPTLRIRAIHTHPRDGNVVATLTKVLVFCSPWQVSNATKTNPPASHRWQLSSTPRGVEKDGIAALYRLQNTTGAHVRYDLHSR